MVQSALPPKKRRQAPLAVKLIGLLIFFGFGLLGCYLVYGAFMFFTRSDQFHIKQFFPSFVSHRLADGTAHPGIVQNPSNIAASPSPKNQPASNPATPPSAVAGSSQPPQQPAEKSPFDSQASNNPTAPPPAASNSTTPAKPAPTDIAQHSPGKPASGVESSAM